jgi:DNA-binding transcriptional ArsR family regulator
VATTADTLDRTFAALADPTRRAILARLASGQASVTELAAPFSMSLPAVSKHLKVLERAGLVARGRRAQWRPAELQAEPLHEVADWLADYRRFWEERLDRFDEYLRSIQGAEPGKGTAKGEGTAPRKAQRKANRKEGEQ